MQVLTLIYIVSFILVRHSFQQNYQRAFNKLIFRLLTYVRISYTAREHSTNEETEINKKINNSGSRPKLIMQTPMNIL